MQCCSTVKVQLTSSRHLLTQVPAGHTTPSATLRCAQPGGKSVLEADRSVLEADLQVVEVHAADGTLAVTATCDTCLSAVMELGSCHIFHVRLTPFQAQTASDFQLSTRRSAAQSPSAVTAVLMRRERARGLTLPESSL